MLFLPTNVLSSHLFIFFLFTLLESSFQQSQKLEAAEKFYETKSHWFNSTNDKTGLRSENFKIKDYKRSNNLVSNKKLLNSNKNCINDDKLNLNTLTKVDTLVQESFERFTNELDINKSIERNAERNEFNKFRRRRKRLGKRESQRKKIAQFDQKLVTNLSELKLKLRNESLAFSVSNLTSLSNLGNLTFGGKDRLPANGSFFCDPKHFFDCTLGNLDNLYLTNLTNRQQTRLSTSNGLTDDKVDDDLFSYCIPIEKKCDNVPDCPTIELMNQTFAADESELVCGCLSNEILCNNTCLDIIHRCDTVINCPNGEDEQNCETHVCHPNHFKCDDYFCVPNEKICNFKPDCLDGSDEKNCSFRKCWFGEFKCDNGQCIRSHAVCDSRPDCIDESDEKSCGPEDFVDCKDGTRVHNSLKCDDWADCKTSHLDEVNCKPCNETNQFKCPNGRCLTKNLVCNGVCECAPHDGKMCFDELNCEKIYDRQNHFLNCGPSALLCAAPKLNNSVYTGGLTHSEKCVQIEFLCDKVVDCLSAGFGRSWPRPLDEFGCNPKGGSYTEEACLSLNKTNIWCSEGRCLPSEFRCDGFAECVGKEDEKNCNFKPCQADQFQCASGECISAEKRCNGKIECSSRDDEFDCEDFKCSSTQFKCGSGQCIDLVSQCDYYVDCPDSSDEDRVHCENKTKKCDPLTEFQCSNGQCIPKEHFCTYYGLNDRLGCVDESHILSKNCRNFTCGPDKFKCEDSYCVDIKKKCDGIIDCRENWNDEEFCPFQCSNEPKCACIDIAINCTAVNITSIPLNIEPEISRVFLSHNHLNQSSLSINVFKKLYRIQILDLGYNDISVLPDDGVFQHLWQLRVLYLNHNKLKTLKNETFMGLAKLRSLILKGNEIETIESYAFKGLSSLKSLDLSYQKITHISKNAFKGLRLLINMDLSHNFLQSLEYGSLSGLNGLLYLDLSNNKFHVMEPTLFSGLNALQTLKTDEFRFCCLVSASISCLPKPDQFSSCEDLMSNTLLRLCIWILGMTSLCGNLIVIFWRLQYNNKNRNRVHSFLIANLAIGDLLMGVYLLIIASVDAYYRGVYFIYDRDWRESNLCQFSGFLSTLSSELSVLTLTFITIDRFITIVFPLRLKRDFSQTVIIMFLIWLLCFLIASVPIFKLDYFDHFYGRSGVCLALHITNERPNGWEYSVFIFLFLNFCSFTLIAFAYVYMFIKARSTNRTDSSLNTTRHDSKVAKRILLIVSTDCICWMPIFIITILSLLDIRTSNEVFVWVAVFVLPFNAAVNPLLYTISTPQFMIKTKKGAFRVNTSLRQTEPESISQRCYDYHSDELNDSKLNNSTRQTTSVPINLRFQLETNYNQPKDKYKSNLLNRVKIDNRNRRALLIKNGRSVSSINRRENSVNEIGSRKKQSSSRANSTKAEIISNKSSNSVLYCLNNINVLSPRKQNVNLLSLRQPKHMNGSNHQRTAAKRKSLRRTQSEYINKSRHQTLLGASLDRKRRQSTEAADLHMIKDDQIMDIKNTMNAVDALDSDTKDKIVNIDTNSIVVDTNNIVDNTNQNDQTGQIENFTSSECSGESTANLNSQTNDECPKIKNSKTETLESLKPEKESQPDIELDQLISGSLSCSLGNREAKQTDSSLTKDQACLQNDLKEKDSNNNNRDI